MGWFDEQIRERMKHDDDAFADAFASMAHVVMGEKISQALKDSRIQTKNAIDEILKFYHIKAQELPEQIKDINDQLEYLLRPSGIMRRMVHLEGAWYTDAIGAMIGMRKEDGTPVALIPNAFSGYSFLDGKTGKRNMVNRKNASMLDVEAICFYKPLPLKKIGIKELLLYIVQTMRGSDFVLVAMATLLVSSVGLLLPRITNVIYRYVIVQPSMQLLAAIFTLMLSVQLAQMLLQVSSTLFVGRLQSKMDIQVQAASMMRILSLPPSFFKEYSAGRLSGTMDYIGSLSSMLANALLSTGLTSLFSLVYISQMMKYGPSLWIPGMVVIAVTVLFSLMNTIVQMRLSHQEMETSTKEVGLNYALLTGIQKIKLAGAEKRAFAKWAHLYRNAVKFRYDPPAFVKFSNVISTSISLVGTIVIYYFTIASNVSLADYYAFNAAYGMVMGAFVSLGSMASTFAQIKPTFDIVHPILETVPEVAENKKVVTRLSGAIELNNVSFRYVDSMPMVIDNLTLKIRPGQYVAIVGTTGCGKSTLMRLLLGFETPQKGAVYYDGKDLSTLDLKSLRRHIGTVMQNGKLFSGDIYSNITISAPWLPMDAAWEAAELAGVADDIHAMPMGMHTLISEGAGGVSGGQRQRLMIARAIAPKPKILMFDEATSALDNLTQKKVSTSLEQLKCTRIVIAHRLSTIQQCDRIIVLDKGQIIEDGKYEELIAKQGFFAELVAKQRLDNQVQTVS